MTVQLDAPAERASSPGGPRQRHLPGEEGLWVFIMGDLLMFGVFFGVLVVSRAKDVAVFAEAQAHLHVELGLLNTVLLLTGSWFVARGMQALKARSPRRTRWFVAALATAVAFASVKVLEYSLLISDGQTPADNDFFMYYFVFTGIHLAHLVIGAVFLTVLVTIARRPQLTVGRFRLAECGAVYWHMVDMLWLVLFPLLYVVR
ncbi:MAG TPA: cytochrome c oxidase subunit 3 [Nocardioidaceae bacterium]|nr:cytochrome c oxidase subunit 3 [Nocardioidaceae bacterium]